MGKITFRADDDLVGELERFDVSKSEVMREALRSYLEEGGPHTADQSVEDLVRERVDECLTDRLEELLPPQPRTATMPADSGRTTDSPAETDVHVRITLETEPGMRVRPETSVADGVTVTEAGEGVRDDEARADCDDSEGDAGKPPDVSDSGRQNTCGQCGTAVEPQHVYCPNCGEKAAHRVFCDCGDEVRSDWAFCPSCGRRTPAAEVLERQ